MNGRRRVLLPVLFAAGCVVDRDAGSLTGIDPGTSTAPPATGGGDDTDTGIEDPRLDMGGFDIPIEECASVGQTSTIAEGPSDILVVVDHAIATAQHAATFQNFSLLIANDQIEDVRVVMLAGYPGDGGGVCIDDPPLGVQQCPATDDNPPLYTHVDERIDAATLLTQVLATHDQWGPAMRPDAWKHIWIVTHADPSLATTDFLAELVALDPAFERLTVHALAPEADDPSCASVVAGTNAEHAAALAALTTDTGGVFEPLCNYSVKLLFDAMLDRIQEVALSCEYDIPPAPDGLVFARDLVNVDYDDGFGLQTIGYVDAVSDCPGVGNGWYYDDALAPTKILMCPQTCGRFQALRQASIEIRFGCKTVPAG